MKKLLKNKRLIYMSLLLIIIVPLAIILTTINVNKLKGNVISINVKGNNVNFDESFLNFLNTNYADKINKDNDVYDFSEITELTCFNCGVSSFEGINELTNLVTITLDSVNSIEISGLNNLESFMASDVKNISFDDDTSSSLKTLILSNNSLTQFDASKFYNLEALDLTNKGNLVNITGLNQIQSLKSLIISGYKGNLDLSNMSSLTYLKQTDIYNTYIYVGDEIDLKSIINLPSNMNPSYSFLDESTNNHNFLLNKSVVKSIEHGVTQVVLTYDNKELDYMCKIMQSTNPNYECELYKTEKTSIAFTIASGYKKSDGNTGGDVINNITNNNENIVNNNTNNTNTNNNITNDSRSSNVTNNNSTVNNNSNTNNFNTYNNITNNSENKNDEKSSLITTTTKNQSVKSERKLSDKEVENIESALKIMCIILGLFLFETIGLVIIKLNEDKIFKKKDKDL